MKTVRIPDVYLAHMPDAGLFINHAGYGGTFEVAADDSEVGIAVNLDVAGVLTLRDECDKWLASKGVEVDNNAPLTEGGVVVGDDDYRWSQT